MASSRRPGTNESRWTVPGGAGAWEAGVNTYGSGKDYTALTTWETDTDQDLVSAAKSAILECDAGSYSDSVTCDGATTSASYFRIIRAASAARHLGVPGMGARFECGNSGWSVCGWRLHEDYAQTQDVAIARSLNSPSTFIVCGSDSTENYWAYVGVLITGANSGSGGMSGLRGDLLSTKYVVHCVASNLDGYGFAISGDTSRVFCCASVNNSGNGYTYWNTEPVYKDSVGDANAGGDWNSSGGSSGTTHNLSSDGTAPGTVNYRNKTLTFVDPANGDCRLVAADTDAIDKGTDLSADATFPFDDDIAFTVRPSGSAWDLGAHEYVATGAVTKHFWSRW